MEFNVSKQHLIEEPADAVVIGLHEPENGSNYKAELQSLPPELSETVLKRLDYGDFKPELTNTDWIYTHNAVADRILLVGLGKRSVLDVEKHRQAYGAAAKAAKERLGVKNITIPIADSVGGDADTVQGIAEAVRLAVYQFDQFKATTKDDNEKVLQYVTFVVGDDKLLETVTENVRKAEIIANGTILARDLSNTPANYLTPTLLAEKAKEVAKTTGLNCTVFDKPTLEKKGFRTLLAVAQGSGEEPRLIILEYAPESAGKQRPIVLVGKAVTFDAGGISIKPALAMDEMKHDMSAGAAVLGAMQAIGNLKPDKRVIGLIPATENLLGADAIKPGDVITSYGGKTIEILNTDAEGRLILADALGFAGEYNPKYVVNQATLTGAIIYTLGHRSAGLMGNDDQLIETIKTASERCGERVWELPLWDEYSDDIKSQTADVKNIGAPKQAGAIAGGIFLKEFIGDYKWAHLDIAGTAWGVKDSTYIPEQGASGYGVRLFVELINEL